MLVEVDAVVVEKRACAVDPVGNLPDCGPRRRFRAPPHQLDRAAKGAEPVFLDLLGDEIAAHEAARELGSNVAQKHARKPGVVFDDAIDVAAGLAPRP